MLIAIACVLHTKKTPKANTRVKPFKGVTIIETSKSYKLGLMCTITILPPQSGCSGHAGGRGEGI